MRGLPLAIGLLAAATPAQAHLMNSGFGPFYDGLAHPLLSPEDLLPALAVILLAGLGGARQGRCVLATLPLAWLAGMAGGWAIGLPGVPASQASGSVASTQRPCRAPPRPASKITASAGSKSSGESRGWARPS